MLSRTDVSSSPDDQGPVVRDENDAQADCLALKDQNLSYLACTAAFAQRLGRWTPKDVIGKTDFDLYPAAVARELMAEDSQVMRSAQPEYTTINLVDRDVRAEPVDHGKPSLHVLSRPRVEPRRAMIFRTPVVGPNQKVTGIDIRLIDASGSGDAGPNGNLVISDKAVLFADRKAAQTLGYPSAAELVGTPPGGLFSGEQLARLERLRSESQRLNLEVATLEGGRVRVITRAAAIHWGETPAVLLCLVDAVLNASRESTTGAGANLSAPPVAGRASESPLQAVSSVAALNGDLAPLGSAASEQGAARELLQLRSSEQRFRHYARSAADFFWELDERLMFRFVSSELESVLGVPRDHLIGRSLQQLTDHPSNVNDADHWREHLQQLKDHLPFRDFEFRWSANGDTRVIRYSGIPVFTRERKFLGYRGVGLDVTASVRQAETTAYHANHDTLTGLVNRRHFESVLSTALEASRHDRQSHALCFMDLDSFKIVNDTCGHQAGDELLRQLAHLFDSLVRKSDVLGRLGGDEFGVFLRKCSVAEALKLANQIRHEVENFQFFWEESRFQVGVSVGLVVVDDRWENIEALFAAADSACYIAKNEGRNRVVVYREGGGNASNRKVATHWVEEINSALENNRLCLAHQKIVPLQMDPDGLRFELFLRLGLPNGELVNPRAFLPSAERYGLMSALDERAIELALAWLRSNPAMQHSVRHVSLNLASSSFTDMAFADKLIRRIAESGIPPAKLCFELTETATIANLSKASAFMEKVSDIGCRFTIDDFGSGLSSFAYMRKLPIDFLKIDGAMIRNILDDPTEYTMVKAISDISKSMGKRTVAEYVESPRLLNAVRDIGIDFAQGFHIGEPELI